MRMSLLKNASLNFQQKKKLFSEKLICGKYLRIIYHIYQCDLHYSPLITKNVSKISWWVIIVVASGTQKFNIIALGGDHIPLRVLTAISMLVLKLSNYVSGISSSLTTCCNLLDLHRKYRIVNIKSINATTQLTAMPTKTFMAISLLSSIPDGLKVPVGFESKLNKFSVYLQKATK